MLQLYLFKPPASDASREIGRGGTRRRRVGPGKAGPRNDDRRSAR